MDVATIDGSVVATRVEWAVSARTRMRGLLRREKLSAGDALVLVPARQVHTLGMSYPIDVLFCDDDGIVLHAVSHLRPWRMTRWVRRARCAVELPAGTLGAQVLRGSRLTLPSGTPRAR